MTTHDPDTPRERQALRVYADDPMEDGDAVLLLDEKVCLELEQLANEWEDDVPPLLVDLLAQQAQRVLVAVARDGEQLLPSDYALWRRLHAGLRDLDVDLLPLRVLPAA